MDNHKRLINNRCMTLTVIIVCMLTVFIKVRICTFLIAILYLKSFFKKIVINASKKYLRRYLRIGIIIIKRV